MQHAFHGSLVSRQFAAELPRRFTGRLGEHVAAGFRRRLARWHMAVAAGLGPASGVTAVHDVAAVPLMRALGFAPREDERVRRDPVLVSRLLTRAGSGATLITCAWSDRLERRVRAALRHAAQHGHRWVLCLNARQLRLVDADRPHAAPFLEFDLAATLADEQATALLCGLLRADAIGGRERSRGLLDEVVDAAAAHARGLAFALQQGVQEALAAIAVALRQGEPRRRTASAAVVDQALTIVFRLLFLLFAEARALVPMWHPVYRDSYAVHGLRRLAEEGQPDGLWDGMQAITRLAHEGCALDDLRVTAFNGRLFEPALTPLGQSGRIDNAAMTRVLEALTDVRDDAAGRIVSVAYADLGVEQLGSIYERLLDAAPGLVQRLDGNVRRQPARPPHPRAGSRRQRRRAVPLVSARRKESGTFYTPRTMADFLVRQTLEPLVRHAGADDILRLRVLDPAMGSGAFLVSACRYLGVAYERALEREGRAPAEEPSRSRALARRLVAQRCLFGVDVNPAATGLARLSLWLCTLASDVPLTFLDHHLLTGDSLIGASLENLAAGWPPDRPSRRRDGGTLPLFGADEVAALMRGLLPQRIRLAAPDDSVEAVRDKERLLDSTMREGPLARWLTLADVWCARWFLSARDSLPPAAWHEISAFLLHGRSSLPERLLTRWIESGRTEAGARRALHWPLQFPEVFFDADGRPAANGGFDAVVGNPPWDVIRADARDDALRRDAAAEAPRLLRFARDTGLTGPGRQGHPNRWHLFVQRALSLVRDGGRVGMVLPWGVAADRSAADLRRRLFERCDTDGLIAFDNAAGIFPVHRGLRFVLLSTTAGRPTETTRCRIGERDLEVLDRPSPGGSAAGAPLAITPALLRRLSGEGLELPWLRGRDDLALADRLHACWPALGSAEGWAVEFGRELNATDDRKLFIPGSAGIPVVEGRHLSPFGVRLPEHGLRLKPSAVREVVARCPGVSRPRLAYRDVAAATNRLTLIAALLPPGVVSTHTVFCLRTRLTIDLQWALCALLNSFAANYLVRLRVTTHVTTQAIERLPAPPPQAERGTMQRLAALAKQVAASGRAEGPPYVQLQAAAARAYGLAPPELAHVLSTFPLVAEAERRAVLDAFLDARGAPSA